MSFRLISISVTLNDLERRNGPYFALFRRIRYICVPTHGLTAFVRIELIDQKVRFYST